MAPPQEAVAKAQQAPKRLAVGAAVAKSNQARPPQLVAKCPMPIVIRRFQPGQALGRWCQVVHNPIAASGGPYLAEVALNQQHPFAWWHPAQQGKAACPKQGQHVCLLAPLRPTHPACPQVPEDRMMVAQQTEVARVHQLLQ